MDLMPTRKFHFDMKKNRRFNISEDVKDGDVDFTVRVFLNGDSIEDYEIYVDVYDLTDRLDSKYAEALVQKAVAIFEDSKRGT